MTTVREKSPTILTEVGARRKIARARDALALADDLLCDLYEGRAWEALGHASWEAMVAAELPELRLIKLRAPVRQERARKLLERGATEREIAAATGSSAVTAHRDVLAITGRAAPNEASPSPFAGMSRSEEALARIAAQGSRGLTSIELDLETDWPLGTTTATLSRLERRGLVRRLPVFRARRAAYVLA